MEKLTHLKQQNKYTPIKKSLLFILLLLTTATLWAQDYDFSALAPSGQTLYYKINSDGTSVTLVPEKNSDPYYTTKPTGNLTIPSTVTNGSNTYTITSIGSSAFYKCTGLTLATKRSPTAQNLPRLVFPTPLQALDMKHSSTAKNLPEQ